MPGGLDELMRCGHMMGMSVIRALQSGVKYKRLLAVVLKNKDSEEYIDIEHFGRLRHRR